MYLHKSKEFQEEKENHSQDNFYHITFCTVNQLNEKVHKVENTKGKYPIHLNLNSKI